jgi:hypothetical protein
MTTPIPEKKSQARPTVTYPSMKHLFQYEQDKHYPLRRIPMAMRMKLDLSGIKLTIRDWSKFSRIEREQLLDMPCDTATEIAAVRDRLQALIAQIDGESGATEALSGTPLWKQTDALPEQVSRELAARGLTVPRPDQWQGLSDLQRFALLKLTRPAHENKKLQFALREFGLLDDTKTDT